MKRETIENIFNFLKEKEDKEIPEIWSVVEKLETHPDGIQYKHNGDLSLYNRNITKLPNDLYVNGFLDLDSCKKLTELPDKLHVGDWLDIRGCNQLTELPNNLYVGDWLALPYTNISEIPNNLYVGNDLYVYNTPLANKYTDEEIRDIVTSKGGTIIGGIYVIF